MTKKQHQQTPTNNKYTPFKKGGILETLQELKRVTVRDVILYIFLSILSISFYYMEKILNEEREKYITLIENIQEFNSRQLFEAHFNLESVQFDHNIHTKLQTLRIQSGANWVHLWGFHNGKSNGIVHVQRMSIIDETVTPGVQRLSKSWQDINVNLFSETILQLWSHKNVPLHRSTSSITDTNYRLHLQDVGIGYEISIPIYIDTFQHPIGILSLYFQSNELTDDENELIETVTQIKEQIEFEFFRRHQDIISTRVEQEHRSLDNK